MSDQENPPQDFFPQPQYLLPQEEQSWLDRSGMHPVLFGVIALGVIFVLYQIIGSLITVLLFGMDLKKASVAGLRIATGAGQLIFILIPTLILVRIASTKPKQYMRLRKPNFLAIIPAIVGVFSLQMILQAYLYLQDKIPLPKFVQDFEQQFKDMFDEVTKMLAGAHSVPELLLVLLVIALIPAIAEEFFFRGLIQPSFEKGLTPVYGVILTGVIFGAYHLNPFNLVPLAALGIYLGFITYRANSIWVSSSAHFFNNALACLALYWNLGDDSVLAGDPALMKPRDIFMLFIISSAIFAGSMILFMKVTEPKQDRSQPADIIA